jgi:hypothetical protein
VGRQAANPAERFEPEGGNPPKGEWKRDAQPATLVVEPATGQKRRGSRFRGEPKTVAERKGRTGRGNGEREAKWQVRIFDPGMEAVKAAAVVGERKAVTSIRPRS